MKVNLTTDHHPKTTADATWRRVPGPPIRNCARYHQQFGAEGGTSERNKHDRKYNFWAFVFGFRIGHIWALSQMSLCTHNPDRSQTTYFSISVNFFPPNGASIFVIAIHQVIWPSPSTLTLHLEKHFRMLFQSSKLKAQSSKLERLFSLKRGKRDVRALSFELSKMSPQGGLAVTSGVRSLIVGALVT